MANADGVGDPDDRTMATLPTTSAEPGHGPSGCDVESAEPGGGATSAQDLDHGCMGRVGRSGCGALVAFAGQYVMRRTERQERFDALF